MKTSVAILKELYKDKVGPDPDSLAAENSRNVNNGIIFTLGLSLSSTIILASIIVIFLLWGKMLTSDEESLATASSYQLAWLIAPVFVLLISGFLRVHINRKLTLVEHDSLKIKDEYKHYLKCEALLKKVHMFLLLTATTKDQLGEALEVAARVRFHKIKEFREEAEAADYLKGYTASALIEELLVLAELSIQMRLMKTDSIVFKRGTLRSEDDRFDKYLEVFSRELMRNPEFDLTWADAQK